MSAPKPGDRVRVTYEARYEGAPGRGVHPDCHQVRTGDGRFLFVPPETTFEVLASPVYVNSDTTEYHHADVAVVEDIASPFPVIYDRYKNVWRSVAGTETPPGDAKLSAGLRLLVRDGKPVLP